MPQSPAFSVGPRPGTQDEERVVLFTHANRGAIQPGHIAGRSGTIALHNHLSGCFGSNLALKRY